MFASKIGLANSIIVSLFYGFTVHIISSHNGIDNRSIVLREVIEIALHPIYFGLIIGFIISVSNSTKKSVTFYKSIIYSALVFFILIVFGDLYRTEVFDYAVYNKYFMVLCACTVAALLIYGNYFYIIKYGINLYIKKYSQAYRAPLNIYGLQGFEIEDKYWLQALNEFYESTHEESWLRAFSESKRFTFELSASFSI